MEAEDFEDAIHSAPGHHHSNWPCN